MINKTFEQCASDEVGTIYADWEQDGFRCRVMRGRRCGVLTGFDRESVDAVI